MGISMSDMDIIKYARTVAENVTAAIESSGLSTLAVSERTGIARTTLTRRLENPSMSPFTVLELAQISETTGVPLEALTTTTSLLAERGEAR